MSERSDRWFALAGSMSLIALLTRPDAALFSATLWLGALSCHFLNSQGAVTKRLTAGLRATKWLGLLPAIGGLVHLVFRRGYYGAWVPNTFHAKVALGKSRYELGKLYLESLRASVAARRLRNPDLGGSRAQPALSPRQCRTAARAVAVGRLCGRHRRRHHAAAEALGCRAVLVVLRHRRSLARAQRTPPWVHRAAAVSLGLTTRASLHTAARCRALARPERPLALAWTPRGAAAQPIVLPSGPAARSRRRRRTAFLLTVACTGHVGAERRSLGAHAPRGFRVRASWPRTRQRSLLPGAQTGPDSVPLSGGHGASIVAWGARNAGRPLLRSTLRFGSECKRQRRRSMSSQPGSAGTAPSAFSARQLK